MLDRQWALLRKCSANLAVASRRGSSNAQNSLRCCRFTKYYNYNSEIGRRYNSNGAVSLSSLAQSLTTSHIDNGSKGLEASQHSVGMKSVVTTTADVEEIQRTILCQKSVIELFQVMESVDPAIFNQIYGMKNGPGGKSFKINFNILVFNLLNQEFFENFTEIQIFLIYLRKHVFQQASSTNLILNYTTNKEYLINFSSFYKAIVRNFHDDPVKQSLIRFMIRPTAKAVRQSLFDSMTSIINDAEVPNKKQVIFTLFDWIATLQQNQMRIDLVNYCLAQHNKYMDVLKPTQILDKVVENFRNNDYAEFFQCYRIPISRDFFKSLLHVIKPLEYPLVFVKLLNCHISFDVKHMESDQAYDDAVHDFTRYLISESTGQNTGLISGFDWQEGSLPSIRFSKKFFSSAQTVLDYEDSKKQVLDIANLLLADKEEVISKSYYNAKFLNLYSIDLLSSIIYKKSKLNDKLTNTLTLQLINTISSFNHPGNQKFMEELNRLSTQHSEKLRNLISLLFFKFDSTLKLHQNTKNYKGLVSKSKLLTKLFSVVLSYSVSTIGPQSVVLILTKIIQLNKQLAHEANVCLADIEDENRKLAIRKKLMMNYNYIMGLLITKFRQKGYINESLKLINYMINLNVQNSNFKHEGFRYKSIVVKDMITEFLMVLKANYSNDPRVILSYIIEFSTNYGDILKFHNHEDHFSYNLTNKELLSYHESKPGFTDLHNARSSFYILNQLGLIRFVYESQLPEPINFSDSQLLQYYEENLFRANLRPELKNLPFKMEHLSIFYAALFQNMALNSTLSLSTLKKLYNNYINTVVHVQSIAAKNEGMYHGHFLLEFHIDDTIVVQFMNQALLLNSVDTAEQFLVGFLLKAKYKPLRVSIQSFEKLIFHYALKVFKRKKDPQFDAYYEKAQHWISVMSEKFNYPMTYWSQLSMVLLNYRLKNSKESYEWYLRLTKNGKDFSKIRHVLLIRIAEVNGWPLPEYLQNVKLHDVYTKELESNGGNIEDSDTGDVKFFQLTKDDILEFDNDKLESFYDESEATSMAGDFAAEHSLELHQESEAETEKATSNSAMMGTGEEDVGVMDSKLFDEICLLLPKLKEA